jgi:hypothetical protein
MPGGPRGRLATGGDLPHNTHELPSHVRVRTISANAKVKMDGLLPFLAGPRASLAENHCSPIKVGGGQLVIKEERNPGIASCFLEQSLVQ